MSDNTMRKVDIIERDEKIERRQCRKIAVIEDCVEQMQKRMGKKYDVVMDLDITSPLRRVIDMKMLLIDILPQMQM